MDRCVCRSGRSYKILCLLPYRWVCEITDRIRTAEYMDRNQFLLCVSVEWTIDGIRRLSY